VRHLLQHVSYFPEVTLCAAALNATALFSDMLVVRLLDEVLEMKDNE
jgi:hypothetical protein